MKKRYWLWGGVIGFFIASSVMLNIKPHQVVMGTELSLRYVWPILAICGFGIGAIVGLLYGKVKKKNSLIS